jgi:putative transposase
MRYRRSIVACGTYFFTVNLAIRSEDTLVKHVELLRDVFRAIRVRHPSDIIAMVVLPDHLHAIWQLPPNDADYSLRWSLIKSGFSRLLPKVERIRDSHHLKRERAMWQRRFWEHQIRDDRDLQTHVDCIHLNPVKHGYVASPVDWPYSSIHQYIASEKLSSRWADGVLNDGGFGE